MELYRYEDIKEKMIPLGFSCQKWISEVDLCCNVPTVEAIPKSDYEARLKADMVAMLKELALKLYEQYDDTDLIKVKYIRQAIQQKINSLKGGKGNYNT